MPETALLTSKHWLTMNDEREIMGCHCGLRADESDCGYGDGIVKHIMELAWDEGYDAGSSWNDGLGEYIDESANPYRQESPGYVPSKEYE